MVLAQFTLVLNKGSDVSCGDKCRARGQMQGEDKSAEKAQLYLRQKENSELNEIRLKKSNCLHLWKLQVQGFLINLSSFYEWDSML